MNRISALRCLYISLISRSSDGDVDSGEVSSVPESLFEVPSFELLDEVIVFSFYPDITPCTFVFASKKARLLSRLDIIKVASMSPIPTIFVFT